MDGYRWYVAETLPRAEARGKLNLERQHFRCFLPRFRTVRRRARKVTPALAPLFPGYVFVRFDRSASPWSSINGTFGVRRLVGDATGRPAAMPEPVMDALLARCDAEGVRMAEKLMVGQSVRITTGPLIDRIGTIEQLDGQGRLKVLFEILGRQAAIPMQRENVTSVRPS